jgi:hypothetical protein
MIIFRFYTSFIKFSFDNVNNEVVLVNNSSTLSTDTCIYINDLSNESSGLQR